MNFKGIDINSLQMSLLDLKQFLNDKRFNNIYNTSLFREDINGDYPLHRYFMYSSHNTYLTKDQLFGTLIQ
jgi:hypothetical protein